MKTYNDISGTSNVTGYEVGEESIDVQFADGSTYTYTAESCGMNIVQQMIQLARSGRGLNGFISRNRPAYASKVS